MKPDDLLDYALGRLDGPARELAEAEVASDPALHARADRLGTALHLLLDDGEPFDPPAGLADRTIRFVAERKARRVILDFVPARVPFRWTDVAVAAGILLAGLLTLVPAIKATQDKMKQANCGFNLQELGASLAGYAGRHNHYPDVSKGPGGLVGDYALALQDDALLRDHHSLHCPCRQGCPTGEGGRPDLRHVDYAYQPGFREQPSAEVEPGSPWMPATVPLLADQPPHDHDEGVILAGNSPNHGARGQNVLFSDLHVAWFPTRRISPSDADMFLNADQRPEPGLGIHDAALLPALFRVQQH